ncbi:MAG: tetratricopeptide repeat protein [Bacteroidetes bacterium]|nr:tetratricopeptide repeat protein [Bacteroidota bacterium]
MSRNFKILPLLFFLVFAPKLSAQPALEEGLKREAISHMNAGRYGEAIDLLNKYISANPRVAEGYNLRALCTEKRSEYERSVLDFRRAIALEPGNQQFKENLARVIQIWYAQLRKKIEGHEREIAINPANPFNYLEIGKSYRHMEEWLTAEEWYDKYLARDDNASPDEVIRYTVILTYTKHIKKGEIILKKYVERYPEDWRLWSRYGYFTMWLGNYKTAQKAFETALSFKPFFKEAQDGLDQAKKEAYVTQYDPRSFEREYPIDRYYRLLRKDPSDLETRFKLVDELINVERMEEAFNQLQIIGIDHYEDPRFDPKMDFVTSFRDTTYRNRIEYNRGLIETDPSNKKAVSEAARYYSYLEEYDNAVALLDTFFTTHPEEKDKDLRFQYARNLAWFRDFDKAIEIVDGLLNEYPDDLDYQLFRAQVSVWNSIDTDIAREYLTNVLEKKPNNVDAVIAMGSLSLLERNYESAQEYATKAYELDPTSDEVAKLQSNVDFQALRAEEERLYKILEEGRIMLDADDCAGALPFYQDYLSKAEPNMIILKEYGDVQFCAQNFEEAKAIYEEVLRQGYNYDAALQKAKVYYAMDDSIGAVNEFKQLVYDNPTLFEPRLYLADSYAKLGANDSARVIYDSLFTWNIDTTQVLQLEQRIEWLPITGLRGIVESFPNSIGFAPFSSFYSDNISFGYTQFGGRLELGFTQYLSFGISYQQNRMSASRSSLNTEIVNAINFKESNNFTTFKGHAFLRFGEHFSAGAGLGVVNAPNEKQIEDIDAFVRYDVKDHFFISANYQNTDAILILFSPYLIDERQFARLYKIGGEYWHKSGVLFQSYFQYITVDDEDEGNDFFMRIGKRWFDYLLGGYEYYYSNWKFDSPYYYSPNNFESHSIWAEAELEENELLTVKLKGKLGFVPHNDFLILGGSIEASYKIFSRVTLSANIGAGSTSRDDNSYRSVSGGISAYWTIY